MRRGFTLVEMCLGMTITAMVGSAVAAFSLAVSQNWRVDQQDRLLSLKADIIAARLRNTLQSSCLIGACRAGSVGSAGTAAAILLWNADANNDGSIQGNETSMIYYDPTIHQLRIYSGSTSETTTWSYATTFTQTSSIDSYRSGKASTLIAENVYGVSFNPTVNNDNSPSSVGFAFRLSQSSSGQPTESITHYGRTVLRAPAAMPSN